MFGKLKQEIIERFEKNLTAHNQKIAHLQEKIALQEKKIENLSKKCGNTETSNARFKIR